VGLVQKNQSTALVSRFEPAVDLFGCVPGAFRDEVPSQVWPDENAHSPWNDFWRTCQQSKFYAIQWIRLEKIYLTKTIYEVTQPGDNHETKSIFILQLRSRPITFAGNK